MTAREVVASYLKARNLTNTGSWYIVPVGRWRVPVFPLAAMRGGLFMHDVHHLVTGYETDFKGECELAGWELASGGCGPSVFFWVDRVLFFPIALLCKPVVTWRAFRRGLGCRNLYRFPVEAVANRDMAVLRRWLRDPGPQRVEQPAS